MQEKSVDEVIDDIDNVLEPVVGCPTIHNPHQRVLIDYEDKDELNRDFARELELMFRRIHITDFIRRYNSTYMAFVTLSHDQKHHISERIYHILMNMRIDLLEQTLRSIPRNQTLTHFPDSAITFTEGLTIIQQILKESQDEHNLEIAEELKLNIDQNLLECNESIQKKLRNLPSSKERIKFQQELFIESIPKGKPPDWTD